MTDDAALGQLARAHGVLSSNRDMEEQERIASVDTLRALLAASSVAADSAKRVRESLAATRADRQAWRYLPDTTGEHVNWRPRYGVAVEELAKDGRFQALGKAMDEDRGKASHRARRR